ncbi:hypothetical protein EK21DRAFT_92964 [Setomelanomma holmii]|uniref:Uncharacterized protein n=1 Tax=Setomelanomma holmii TaxID=210430 RepID=A0A9P4H1X3_9PLEO|nr:hypothetical protein EK21DRAFT_92964 [Setomelanomma holmii]
MALIILSFLALLGWYIVMIFMLEHDWADVDFENIYDDYIALSMSPKSSPKGTSTPKTGAISGFDCFCQGCMIDTSETLKLSKDTSPARRGTGDPTRPQDITSGVPPAASRDPSCASSCDCISRSPVDSRLSHT